MMMRENHNFCKCFAEHAIKILNVEKRQHYSKRNVLLQKISTLSFTVNDYRKRASQYTEKRMNGGVKKTDRRSQTLGFFFSAKYRTRKILYKS